MLRLNKLGKAVGIVKVAYAVVSLAKLTQHLRRDLPRQSAEYKQNKNLYIKLFVNKSKAFHLGSLNI